MTEKSIFIAIHVAALALWIIDSRSIYHLRSRGRYLRRFKQHEKMHKAHMHAMDVELAELINQEKEQYRKNSIQKHPSGWGDGLPAESKEILNEVSKNFKITNKQRLLRQDKIWPDWDKYMGLDR